MTDREAILAALPDSVGSARPVVSVARQPLSAEPWEVFEERLKLLGGRMASLAEVEALDRATCYVEPDARAILGWGEAGDVWSAAVGITTGLAIADTGTLLLTSGPLNARMASLAPKLHVVLVRTGDIVHSVEDVFPILPTQTSVLVSGTSRTADIEGVLVRGVHGPQEVWAVRV